MNTHPKTIQLLQKQLHILLHIPELPSLRVSVSRTTKFDGARMFAERLKDCQTDQSVEDLMAIDDVSAACFLEVSKQFVASVVAGKLSAYGDDDVDFPYSLLAGAVIRFIESGTSSDKSNQRVV